MSAASEVRPESALRILVIEDERKLASAIAEGLEGNGYEVALADSGETGIRRHDHLDAASTSRLDLFYSSACRVRA